MSCQTEETQHEQQQNNISIFFSSACTFSSLTPPFDSGCVRLCRKAAGKASIKGTKGTGTFADRLFVPSGWDVTIFDSPISVL